MSEDGSGAGSDGATANPTGRGRPDGGASVEEPSASETAVGSDGDTPEGVVGESEAGGADDGTGEAGTAAGSGASAEPGTSERDGGSASEPAATSVRRSTLRSTNHWVGIAGLTFVTAGLGVATRSRALFLAAVVGVGYLAYANATEAPEPSLAVGRSLDDPEPEPGDRVRVTVTVENTGDAVLPDLRIVDQVPAALAVVDGTARAATSLRPGARVTFGYTVLARRGDYSFAGIDVLARNVSGSREREVDLETRATGLTCMPPVDTTSTVPLRGLTSPYTGRVATDAAGEGVEFASVREYQHGDALSRIDWNHYARGGDLTTMEFREERMATVVVLLDLRPAAYLQAGEDGPHAVDRGIDAPRRLFNSLIDTGDRVGIAALSAEEVWLPPGAGPTHRAKARHLLTSHPALSPTPPDKQVYVPWQMRALMRRLDDDAQVVFVSPVPDATSVYLARAVQVRDHPVTVVSPDPTTTDTESTDAESTGADPATTADAEPTTDTTAEPTTATATMQTDATTDTTVETTAGSGPGFGLLWALLALLSAALAQRRR